jgi:CSLREA domain-containing protein
MRRFALSAILFVALAVPFYAIGLTRPVFTRITSFASGLINSSNAEVSSPGKTDKTTKVKPLSPQADVSLTTLGSAYTQNFDTLSNTAGSTTNNLTIPGWSMTESGNGARDNEQYAVDTGGSNTGDTYSYGAAGSTERALGQLRSGTNVTIFGASFVNNTGATITSLDIAYTGEEWRLGTAGRTDQINFEYSTNATDLVTGTWTGVNALNFVTPDTATVGAKNGNAAADRTAKSSTISGLSIPNGATFWIRWSVVDASGADDGLAVDDFSLTPQGTVGSPGTLEFNSATYSGSEHGNSIALTVTRTGGSSGSVGAQVTQTDGTATGGGSLCNPASGDDYTKATYAVIFGDGETSKTVNIPVCNDALDETDETFTATLGSVSGGATLGSQSSATVTIIDDDWTVTTAADTNDGLCDADCSLREAIAGAAPGDAIRFSSLFDSAQTIAVGGQLQITKPLTINGPGANLLTVDATGGTDGAFYISTAGGQTTTLSGMTITGTDTATGVGGAIKAYNGALILDGVHVKNSSAANAGGGVYIETATGSVVRRSTFSGNSANRCGGLMVFGGSATIENATFSGDSSAAGVGGGLCGEFNAALTVRNSTITNNTAATTGGGIRLQSGSTLDIGGTIVAGNNSTGGQPEIQNDGSATSSGYNLIGDSSGDAADTVNAIGYQLTDIPDTNPMLQPLGYYFGGKIPAHTLYIGSQAFDHGSSFGLATDALGNARIVDHPDVANTADGADIGAVESRAPTAANTTVSGRVRTESGAGIGNARVTISGPGLSSPVTVITNNFGHFRFDQIQAGQTYVVSVSAKRYTFSPPSRAVSVQQDVTGIDFTAER